MKVAVSWKMCGYVDIPEAKTVGRTTNSITFRTSVTEKEIEYIREKVI